MPTFKIAFQCDTPFPDGSTYTNTARVSFEAVDLADAGAHIAAMFGVSASTAWDFTPEMIPPPPPSDLPPPPPPPVDDPPPENAAPTPDDDASSVGESSTVDAGT